MHAAFCQYMLYRISSVVYIRMADGYKSAASHVIRRNGCGTGGTIEMLESFGSTDNVDKSDEAIRYMKKLGYKGAPKKFWAAKFTKLIDALQKRGRK